MKRNLCFVLLFLFLVSGFAGCAPKEKSTLIYYQYNNKTATFYYKYNEDKTATLVLISNFKGGDLKISNKLGGVYHRDFR